MKFKNYKITEDKYGFEYATSDVMKGNEMKPCMWCKTETEYIEIYTESHFCSNECVDNWYNKYMS